MASVSCHAVGTLWVKFISGSLLPTWRLLGSKMRSEVHIAMWTLEAQHVVCPFWQLTAEQEGPHRLVMHPRERGSWRAESSEEAGRAHEAASLPPWLLHVTCGIGLGGKQASRGSRPRALAGLHLSCRCPMYWHKLRLVVLQF